ncbi:unnamed protein product [Ixodes pacificus]
MTSMTSAAVSSRNAYIKYLRKTVRALFPVLKEKGQPLADVTEKLTLQFNHGEPRFGLRVLSETYLERYNFGASVVHFSANPNCSTYRCLDSMSVVCHSYCLF